MTRTSMTRTAINPSNIRTVLAAALLLVAAATTAVAGHHKNMEKKADKDIVDTAVAAGDFTTLATALEAAGLVGTLKGDGPFTVFAPTDAAFAALPDGTVESLLKPENKEQLVAVLTYHVVPGKVTSADVVKLNSATTVNGQSVDIDASGGTVKIDGATVTAVDIAASNGVIHVIDQVILPE